MSIFIRQLCASVLSYLKFFMAWANSPKHFFCHLLSDNFIIFGIFLVNFRKHWVFVSCQSVGDQKAILVFISHSIFLRSRRCSSGCSAKWRFCSSEKWYCLLDGSLSSFLNSSPRVLNPNGGDIQVPSGRIKT